MDKSESQIPFIGYEPQINSFQESNQYDRFKDQSNVILVDEYDFNNPSNDTVKGFGKEESIDFNDGVNILNLN